jgi:nicotinamide-nucleotide amidase
MTVKIEIICIGDELLAGITVNSNAHWLASRIAELGATTTRIVVIGDAITEIASAIQDSLKRKPALLITTGGLGATHDDVTLEGVAVAFGRKTTLDQTAVRMLKKSYARRGLKYQLTKSRLKMATIPEGSSAIQNPVGSAPAVSLTFGSTEIFCLQGVPSEMKAIFKKNIVRVIRKAVGPFTRMEQNYEVEGITEAMLAPALTAIVDSVPKESMYLKTHPRGYVAKKPRLRIQIVCRGPTKTQVDRLLKKISIQVIEQVSLLQGRIHQGYQSRD